MSVMSNLLTILKAFSGWSGAIHQVTIAETAPARTAAAGSGTEAVAATSWMITA